MEEQYIKLIFGLKLKQIRTDKKLSLFSQGLILDWFYIYSLDPVENKVEFHLYILAVTPTIKAVLEVIDVIWWWHSVLENSHEIPS